MLHALVFEPFNVVKNDSWGKLKHYWFPNAKTGDITNYQQDLVVDNNGTNETVNIRVGAAIGQDDTMLLPKEEMLKVSLWTYYFWELTKNCIKKDLRKIITSESPRLNLRNKLQF